MFIFECIYLKEVFLMKPNITEENRSLFETVLSLESFEECAAFFEDICTIKELQDLSQRLAVARISGKGKQHSLRPFLRVCDRLFARAVQQ